jgi:hypothetical protein
MIGDLDQARLEQSYAYLVEHYLPAILPASGMNLDQQKDLCAAVADLVTSLEDFCAERVAEIDRDLQRRGGYTLSFLRDQLLKPIREMIFSPKDRTNCEILSSGKSRQAPVR